MTQDTTPTERALTAARKVWCSSWETWLTPDEHAETHRIPAPKAIPPQCGLCGSFLPKPTPGERWLVCPQCRTEFEVPA